MQIIAIIAIFAIIQDISHKSVQTYVLSSQTSFKCVAGYMAYDIALPRYADGLSCNIPVDKLPFVRSEKDIVLWLFGFELDRGFQHFSDAGDDIGRHEGSGTRPCNNCT